MVEGEGAFEPVCGDVPGVEVPADVVDQHMNPRKGLQQLLRHVSYVGLGGQVCDEEVDPPATGGADLPSRFFSAYPIPADDRQVGTHLGQAKCGSPTNAARGAGDQHCLADHRPARRLGGPRHESRSLTVGVRSERQRSPGFIT